MRLSMHRIERGLVAIVSADVKDYDLLIVADDEGKLAQEIIRGRVLLLAYRQAGSQRHEAIPDRNGTYLSADRPLLRGGLWRNGSLWSALFSPNDPPQEWPER